MEIKDSGERRKFETSAVRDIQDGKGRCDWMPLDVIAGIYLNEFGEYDSSYQIFYNLNMFPLDNTHIVSILHLHFLKIALQFLYQMLIYNI